MSDESHSSEPVVPRHASPLSSELEDRTLWHADGELQSCIRSGDISSVDTILSPWEDPETPTLVTPEARKYLHACPYVAMDTGQFRLAQYLLEKGIHVDPCCCSSAIAHALDTNSTLILEMLLEHGWDTEQIFNLTAGAVLKSLYHNEALVKWLLSHGASASAVSPWGPCGMVPIERAAQYAPLSMLKLLLKHGGRVQSTDAVVKAAIGDAEGEPGRLEVVEFLAELGAPINAFDLQFCRGEQAYSLILMLGRLTALHHAAKAGKRDMVALLLKLGADKSSTTLARKTALDLAVENGHEDIVLMLQNRMTPTNHRHLSVYEKL